MCATPRATPTRGSWLIPIKAARGVRSPVHPYPYATGIVIARLLASQDGLGWFTGFIYGPGYGRGGGLAVVGNNSHIWKRSHIGESTGGHPGNGPGWSAPGVPFNVP